MKSNGLNQTKTLKKRVACIGRWSIIHNGLKKFFVDLAKNEEYDKVIIMIDSSYKGGNLENCINATDKEKMLRAIMKAEGISTKKVIIVPMPKAVNYREWVSDIYDVCKIYRVTHYCAVGADKEEFIDALDAQHKKCDFSFIDSKTDFPYTTNELCTMISEGDYEAFLKLIPDEVKPILAKYSYEDILESNKDKEWDPIDKQQFVNLVFVVKDKEDGKKYVLLGEKINLKKRGLKLLSLPGGAIQDFETAIAAAIKYFYKSTGLKVKIIDNSTEPAIIRIEKANAHAEKMYHLGRCTESVKDFHINEIQGFVIYAEEKLSSYKNAIKTKGIEFYDIDTLSLVKLEGHQNEVFNKALRQLKAFSEN